MSWYLTIRSDSTYSCSTATTPLVAFLASLPELQQTRPMAFCHSVGSPSVSLILAECNVLGCYAFNGEYRPAVNVVEMVCSVHEKAEWYDQLATRIAAFLDWDAFEDHENRQLRAKADV
jgi:hypothetical protein